MIRNSWWVDFRFNHARYRKRSPENSKRGAEAYEAALRQKLARGEEIDKVTQAARDESFEEFGRNWFKEYVVPNNKPTEQKAKRLILSASLVPFFGKMPINRISANEIERYKAYENSRSISNKTINNRLAVLRKCLASAYEWRGLNGVPPKIKALKAAPPKTDYLTLEEAKKLLAHAEGCEYEMILLVLKTGMRQGELRGLQWESVDWENRALVILHSLCDCTKTLVSPKSNRERYVPLTDDVFGLLAARKQSSGYVFRDKRGPFSGERLLRILNRVRKKAGIRKIGWHTLRHTFASQLTVNGVPLRFVQELLGHSTITVTMRYSHVAPGGLRAAVDSLMPNYADSAILGNR